MSLMWAVSGRGLYSSEMVGSSMSSTSSAAGVCRRRDHWVAVESVGARTLLVSITNSCGVSA